MKITAIATMAIIAGATAHAKINVGSTERTVVVCMSADEHSLQAGEARALASKMFGDIGVTIRWGRMGHGCPMDGIQISLAENSPKSVHPGTLAYAQPYEGTHICVFYDRIALFPEKLLPRVLAHVLVHEITHILQGVARHSNQGVMQAHWDGSDFADMRRRPLAFTKEDIELIHLGLAWRAARVSQPTMATNIQAEAVTDRIEH
jgi:hypothetical protein